MMTEILSFNSFELIWIKRFLGKDKAPWKSLATFSEKLSLSIVCNLKLIHNGCKINKVDNYKNDELKITFIIQIEKDFSKFKRKTNKKLIDN